MFVQLSNICDPDRIQTCDLSIRSATLYSAELQDLMSLLLDSNQRRLATPDYKSGSIDRYEKEAILNILFLFYFVYSFEPKIGIEPTFNRYEGLVIPLYYSDNRGANGI